MPAEQRRYIDPLKCIYIDEDGEVHFDGPRIARTFDVPLGEAIAKLQEMFARDGIETVLLDRPKKPRGH